MQKEIFYHGSGRLFRQFDLSDALEGVGKVKFGFGVYVTSSYASAAHYSGTNDRWLDHFVYTVEVPAKTGSNFIAFKQPVNPIISSKAEVALEFEIPEKAKLNGKEFRKFLAKNFTPKDLKDKKLANFEGERAASRFLLSIGVEFIEWPYSWNNPALGQNRAVLDDSSVRIVKVDAVLLDEKKKLIAGSERNVRSMNHYGTVIRQQHNNLVMKCFRVSDAIRMHYPEIWARGIQIYPVEKCAAFCKVANQWGIFSNFGDTPIQVEDIVFRNCEQLFQALKFTEIEAVREVLAASGQTIKMKAKKWGQICMRPDWGLMIVDAMAFALTKKYEQCPEFREALERSKGLFIVEDQTSFPGRTANSWGAKREDNVYVGPNLLGQLLMALRDNGRVEYKLTSDAFNVINAVKV